MIQKIKRNMFTKVLAFALMIAMIAQCAVCEQKVKADDSVFLEITGYQISTTLEAYRTLYSIADPSGKTEEVGLVYGLTDSVTEADMVVGSTNSTVYSYAATSAGKSDVNYSSNEDATTYVRTMEFIKSAEFFSKDLSIRAYAKLTDDSYVYSDISTVSVFRIADTLYQGCLMSNMSGHNYLYDSVLTVVNPSYAKIEYNPGNIIVPVETTEVKTTVADGSTDCIMDANTTVGKWGYYVGSWADATATYAGGTALDDFTLNILTNNGTAWGVQAFTAPISLNVGSTYTVNVTLNSTAADASVLFKDDVSGTVFETKTLEAGDNVYTGTFTATADTASFFFDFGAVAAGTTVKVTAFSLTETEAQTTAASEETTTISSNHTVNTSLAQPTGLTWAGNDALPYYFAWGAVDGADSYDVFVNGVCVTNVVSASANLDVSAFTNGEGTYTIGVGAVFGDEVSANTTIEYVYGTATVTTTAAQETTTVTRETTTVDDGYTDCVADNNTTVGKWGYYIGSWANATATYAGGTELNDFTLNILTNNASAWAIQAFTAPITVNAGSTYNVRVTLNSTTAGASVLFKDDISGTSLETKTLAVGDNVFTGTFTAADTAAFYFDLGTVVAGTTVKVTAFSLEETATQTTTASEATTAASSNNHTVNTSLAQPAGLTWAGNDTLPLYFAWGAVDGAGSYDVYVNGNFVLNVTDPAANIPSSAFTSGAGTYTIGVGAVFGSEVSAATTISFAYSTSGTVVTTTAASGTQETTSGMTFTTDSSIAQPFGLVLSSPENGYVNIVWGAGTINCYNVYVDGERRRTGIKAQSLTIPVYFEGTHTIEIATVVGTTESIRISGTIAIVGVGEKETESPTCPEELKPVLRSDLSFRDDRILMQINNKTNGKYSDSQIYWVLVGYNTSHQLCYLDASGNMIPANTGMNTITINNRQVADVSHTLAEASYVYVPSISSARMYLSYEKPIYLTFNQAADGTIGFAGPDINNDTDPNAGTLYEFAEFTIDGKYYWGNTTRVDFFSFPVVTRLLGHTLYEQYDKTVGEIGTRDEIFAAFANEVPNAFKSLIGTDRIMAPCKTTFNSGGTYANYFDAYINEFWTKYTYEDLVFSCEGGVFTGRVSGDKMYFTKSGDSTVYTISKPSTQDVLEGKGAFASGNSTELVIEAQLCAAFNRGVATEPTKWNKPQYYYQSGTYNAYSGFFHEHSITGLAYGFCYDDVNDQSTLLWYDYADALVIDMKW